MLPAHLVCWLGSLGIFLWTEWSRFLSLELSSGIAGSGQSLFVSHIFESVDVSQLTIPELTSQPHCSKCERTLRVRNDNESGVELDWEPKFKRKHWQVIKTLNGKQRGALRSHCPQQLTTAPAAPISVFDLSPLFWMSRSGQVGDSQALGDSTGLSLKKMINCQMAAELWSLALLFVLVASYSSLSVSWRQTAGLTQTYQ